MFQTPCFELGLTALIVAHWSSLFATTQILPYKKPSTENHECASELNDLTLALYRRRDIFGGFNLSASTALLVIGCFCFGS